MTQLRSADSALPDDPGSNAGLQPPARSPHLYEMDDDTTPQGAQDGTLDPEARPLDVRAMPTDDISETDFHDATQEQLEDIFYEFLHGFRRHQPWLAALAVVEMERFDRRRSAEMRAQYDDVFAR